MRGAGASRRFDYSEYSFTYVGQAVASEMSLRPHFQRGKQSQRLGRRLPSRGTQDSAPRNDSLQGSLPRKTECFLQCVSIHFALGAHVPCTWSESFGSAGRFPEASVDAHQFIPSPRSAYTLDRGAGGEIRLEGG